MKRVFEFCVSINNEDSQDFITEDSFYHVVALKASQQLKFTPKENGEITVRIWQTSLCERYGKYTYKIKDGKAIYQHN